MGGGDFERCGGIVSSHSWSSVETDEEDLARDTNKNGLVGECGTIGSVHGVEGERSITRRRRRGDEEKS